jgi:hypothetical protein
MPAPSLLQSAASLSGLLFDNVIYGFKHRYLLIGQAATINVESTVANKNRTKKTPKVKAQKEDSLMKPWVTMRGGLIIMAITSLVLVVLIAWQVTPSTGWLEGIGWGLLFGGMIWIIFFGNLWITKKLRNK